MLLSSGLLEPINITSHVHGLRTQNICASSAFLTNVYSAWNFVLFKTLSLSKLLNTEEVEEEPTSFLSAYLYVWTSNFVLVRWQIQYKWLQPLDFTCALKTFLLNVLHCHLYQPNRFLYFFELEQMSLLFLLAVTELPCFLRRNRRNAPGIRIMLQTKARTDVQILPSHPRHIFWIRVKQLVAKSTTGNAKHSWAFCKNATNVIFDFSSNVIPQTF